MSLMFRLVVTVATSIACGSALAQATPLRLAPAAAEPNAEARPRREAPLRLDRPQQERRATEPTAAASAVDESALRFYASQGDAARVAAEIRRLKTLNSAWQPPEDLFSATASIDERPLWSLFADKRYAELREQIAQIQAERPNYTPSSELATKLLQAERRAAVVQASEDKDWQAVIEAAMDAQDLLICREIDVLWRVAEAFAAASEQERAIDVYRYILQNCDNAKERLATVQKASQALPAPITRELLGLGRRRGTTSEFDEVALDLARSAIGKATSGEFIDAPGERDLKAVESSARRGRSNDAALLGWYAYSRKDFAQAKEWFALGVRGAPNPKAAEGLVLAMRNLGELEQAEALAYQHRDADALIRKAYIEIVATDITGPTARSLIPERRARYEEVINRDHSALGAQTLGWSLYNNGEFAAAQEWFERSLKWGASEPAAVGLVVASQRVGDRARMAEAVKTYRDQFPAVASLSRLDGRIPTSRGAGRVIAGTRGASNSVTRRSVALYEAGKYREAAALLDEQGGRLPAGMQELRAWAHYNASDYRTAQAIFTELKKKRPSKTVEHGQFLAEIHVRGNPHRWWAD